MDIYILILSVRMIQSGKLLKKIQLTFLNFDIFIQPDYPEFLDSIYNHLLCNYQIRRNRLNTFESRARGKSMAHSERSVTNCVVDQVFNLESAVCVNC